MAATCAVNVACVRAAPSVVAALRFTLEAILLGCSPSRAAAGSAITARRANRRRNPGSIAPSEKLRAEDALIPGPACETTLAPRLQNSKLLDFKSIPQTECQRSDRAARQIDPGERASFMLSCFRYLDCIVSAPAATRERTIRKRRKASSILAAALRLDTASPQIEKGLFPGPRPKILTPELPQIRIGIMMYR